MIICSIILLLNLLNFFVKIGILLLLIGMSLKILIIFKILILLLFVLLEFLINFVLFLDEFDYFANSRSIQYSMHGGISKISQNERNGIEQDDVDVIVAQFLCFDESLLYFLQNKQIDFIKILDEGLVEVLLNIFNVWKKSL